MEEKIKDFSDLKKSLTDKERNNIEKIFDIKNVQDKETDIISCINNCTSPIEQKDEKGNILLTKEQTIFRAFNLFDLSDTKVIILGQDPYPDPDKAHGLAFSVLQDYTNKQGIDDSLKNIFDAVDEYLIDQGKKPLNKENTELKIWANNNNVLLLNTVLTYDEKNSFKIRKETWQPFIEKIMNNIIEKKYQDDNSRLAIFLWGKPAQRLFYKCIKSKNYKFDKAIFKNNKLINKEIGINIGENIIIFFTSHPSNKSAWRGFNDNAPKHFEACNDFLGSKNAIKWEDI